MGNAPKGSWSRRRLLACALACAVAPCGLDGAPPPVPVTQAFVQDIPGTAVSFRMLPIPAGTVRVRDASGAEREVAVGPLWIAEHETTWDMYDIWVFGLDAPGGDGADAVTRPSKPYIPPDRGFGHAGHPAISMTQRGAAEFCVWLSRVTGRTYRLPTEAEWQHACLAGSPGPYAFGPDAAQLDAHAWTKATSPAKPQAIRQKGANAWGLYDMHGNVGEWAVSLDGKPIVCGGSHKDGPDGVRADSRQKPTPAWQMSDPQLPKSVWWTSDCGWVGFRVVCVPDAPADPKEPDHARPDR